MKLQIDSTVCTGHGRCYVLHPELFVANEEGFGAVREATDVSEALARAVTFDCPEQAITLAERDDDRKEFTP